MDCTFFFFLQVFRFVCCAVRWDFLLKNSGYFFMEKASCESVSVLNWPILWIQTPAGVFFICRGSTLPQAHVRLNPQSLDLIKSSSWHMAYLPLRHGSPAPYSELGHKLMYWELVWSFSFLIPLPSFKFFFLLFLFFCFLFFCFLFFVFLVGWEEYWGTSFCNLAITVQCRDGGGCYECLCHLCIGLTSFPAKQILPCLSVL